jgi:hypothetical protein
VPASADEVIDTLRSIRTPKVNANGLIDYREQGGNLLVGGGITSHA